ncbi:unnamed protein product, partial [Closterium sp. NIES-53]
TAQALYAAVVSRFSLPATAALGRLLLPYLFPELSAFAIVEDLVSHLCTSDARFRATVPAEFLDRNQPKMFITLYFIVTRLPDSLRSVRDHFLSLDPTSLTVDLLEQHLLAAKTSAVAVGAARGTPRLPFFEGCSPSPLAPSYASAAAAADVSVSEDVGAASASAKRRSSKGKGGRGGGGGSGGGGGGSGSGGGGSSGGSGGSGGGGGGGPGGGSGGSDGVGEGSGGSGGSGGGGTGGSRTGPWHGGLEGGIAAAALRASESGTLPGTAPAQALHTFMLDSGASRCFFRESTTLTPLPAPIPVRLADPSGGPVVARSSSVLACPAVPSSSLSGLHLPSFSTNLVSAAALQERWPLSPLLGVSVCRSARAHGRGVTWLRQVAASYSCRLLSHQTLLWHRHMGHPPLPHLRGMHSRLLVSGLPRSLPPLPPCLPCVEGWQRAAPHSSSFPPTTAPLHTLHMDVWGPARVSGQSRERYFLLVVDDYTRYTTVFPLRSKGEVVDVLIPWICTVRLQLREWFGQDLPVLHLHYDRGGEFSSNLWPDFCRREGILQSFTLSDSPQQNGIAERRIGLVMEVARTSMIHVAAPRLRSDTLRISSTSGPMSLCRRPRRHCVGQGRLAMRRCSGSGVLFYHPTSRRVLPSQDVTFDESVPFYRPFPYRSAPPLPPPLFLAPGPPPVDPLPPQGPAPSGVSQVDPLPGIVPVKVAIVSSAAPGAASWGAASGGAEPGGEGSEGAGSGGAKPGGAELEGVER